MRDLLGPLVDEPEEVLVEEFPLRRSRGDSVFEIEVAPEDAGKVIGRQGRTIRALRNLLELRGVKDDRRYELELIDP
ncbi:MAG: KH domain-containing protein [Deltaproteobacteria bacterium]|nr:KH domain-containing protein [Deltaproteobacteria bacterium]